MAEEEDEESDEEEADEPSERRIVDSGARLVDSSPVTFLFVCRQQRAKQERKKKNEK